MSDFQLSLLLPQVFLLVFGLLALAVGLWSASDGWLWHSLTPGLMAVAGLLLAMYGQIAIVLWLLPRFRPLPVTQLSGALTIDAAGAAFGLLACLGTLIVVVMSMDHLSGDTRNQGEYYFLLLFACGAVTIIALAADLLIVYLGIEFLGICSYALAGFSKSEDRTVEAALKYFLFGSTCSAAMLFGMSLLFGHAVGSEQSACKLIGHGVDDSLACGACHGRDGNRKTSSVFRTKSRPSRAIRSTALGSRFSISTSTRN